MIPQRIRDRLLGCTAVWRLIESAAEGNELHACIISGPAGTGKRTAAHLLAETLVCQADAGRRPCGECLACRKAEKDIHPDIITLHKDKQTGYSGEMVRNARQDIYVMPNEAARKVYIFEEGDALLPAAQNALLKVLEEPPAYAALLILCEDPNALLETVRSRCTEVRTEPLPPELVKKLVAARVEATDGEIDAAVRSANGSVGAALAAIGGASELEKIAADCCLALAATDEAALYGAFFAAEKLARDELESVFAMVVSIIGDAMVTRFGADTPRLPQFAEVSAKLRAVFSPMRLQKIYNAARQGYENTSLYLTPGNLLAAATAILFNAATGAV